MVGVIAAIAVVAAGAGFCLARRWKAAKRQKEDGGGDGSLVDVTDATTVPSPATADNYDNDDETESNRRHRHDEETGHLLHQPRPSPGVTPRPSHPLPQYKDQVRVHNIVHPVVPFVEGVAIIGNSQELVSEIQVAQLLTTSSTTSSMNMTVVSNHSDANGNPTESH